MSEDVLYFGLAFQMDIKPDLPKDVDDELYEFLDEFYTECAGTTSIEQGKDFFYVTTGRAKGSDGIYGIHSLRKVETELLQNLQTFRLWLIDKGYEVNIKAEVKPFVDLYYNGADASPVYMKWEDIQ